MTSCAFVAPSTAVQMSGDAGISAFPDGDNLFTWIGTISGSDGTVRANSGHALRFAVVYASLFNLPELILPLLCILTRFLLMSSLTRATRRSKLNNRRGPDQELNDCVQKS